MDESEDEQIARLLGNPLPEKKPDRLARAEKLLEGVVQSRRIVPRDEPTLSVTEVQHGVTVSWLAQVFHMDPQTVRKRIIDCPPMERMKAGNRYDLRVVTAYLVTPKVDIEKYFKTMKASELPTHLQKDFWEAQRKKQQWEEEAGHLWRDEAVQEVFGDVFKLIKSSMQLWPDVVARQVGITSEQRTMLVAMADALQNQIHEKLIVMPATKRTRSTLAEVPDPVEMEVDDGTRFL